jgi:mRNA interferase HigB
VRVISTRTLREYVAAGHADAATPLFAWAKAVKAARWAKFADVRRTLNSADAVGDCVVFNVGGNNYRLVARIRYAAEKVFVLRVMTHAVYDRVNWADECGCHTPPPKRPKAPGKRK